MATRKKTIVYTFPLYTADVVDATVTNLAQMTIKIPETVIAFSSVFVDVGFQDIVTATGGTISEHRVGLRLGAAGYTTFTETDDIVNTGENLGGVIGPVDFTSHFTTNWTGTSMTCDLQVYFDQNTGTTLGMRNITARVFITYTYDDDPAVNPTQIKTVQIPLESLVGGITATTNSQIGSNQIPQLTGSGGLLPEASPVIADYAFVIEANETNAGTTDFTVSCSIDSGGDTAFGVQETALASSRYLRWVYKPSVPTTTAAHSFHMWSSTGTTFMAGACIDLYVTYEFDATATTRLLNSIVIPLELESPVGNTTSADKSRITRDFIVSDKGTVNLRQSAVRIHANISAAVTVSLAVGAQSARAYTQGATLMSGGTCLQQRIDSGGAQGAAFTLARGRNPITIDLFGNSASVLLTNASGYIVLNYESDMEAGGPGANTHTMYELFHAWDASPQTFTALSARAISIPETDYWLAGFGFQAYLWANTSPGSLLFDCEYQSGEGPGAGWERIYADIIVSDSEVGCSMVYFRARDAFRRCPQDTVGARMDVEASRQWRITSFPSTQRGLVAIFSTHAIVDAVAGTITGTDAGLSTEVRLMDEDTDEVMQKQTLSAGDNTFSFPVYCDAINYSVDAYQSGTKVGRSDIDLAA